MTQPKPKLAWTDLLFAVMAAFVVAWLIVVVHFIVKWW